MPKNIAITIIEDVNFLNNSYSRQTSSLQQERIKTLLYVATEKYHDQSDIAKKLDRYGKTNSRVAETLCYKRF
jgi:DNA-binding MarR family transcriptional regulator